MVFSSLWLRFFLSRPVTIIIHHTSQKYIRNGTLRQNPVSKDPTDKNYTDRQDPEEGVMMFRVRP